MNTPTRITNSRYSPTGTQTIYGLYCPIFAEPRYVGHARNIGARYRQHTVPIYDNAPRTLKTLWVMWLRLVHDVKPRMRPIDSATTSLALATERARIDELLAMRFPLINSGTWRLVVAAHEVPRYVADAMTLAVETTVNAWNLGAEYRSAETRRYLHLIADISQEFPVFTRLFPLRHGPWSMR
jgi:hypothetical protein